MSEILQCTNCGSDCCINLALPMRVYPRCPNQCCIFTMKVAKCQVLRYGQIVGELTDSARTVAAFNPDATDGSQYAIGIISEDFATDTEGRRILSTMNPPFCGPNEAIVYVCGRFKKNEILGDLAAARASGLQMTEVGGEVLVGGAV